MTFDQMVRRASAESADANAALSTTSFLRWCVHDVNGTALICPACDVSWLGVDDESCWVCGEPGQSARDLRRATPVRGA